MLKEKLALLNSKVVKSELNDYKKFITTELGYKPKWYEYLTIWKLRPELIPKDDRITLYFKWKYYLYNKIIYYKGYPILRYYRGEITIKNSKGTKIEILDRILGGITYEPSYRLNQVLSIFKDESPMSLSGILSNLNLVK